MTQSYNDDFEVTFSDPEDAKISWRIDPAHWFLAHPPLAQELVTVVVKRGLEWDVIWVNGYMYVRQLGPPSPRPEVMERGAATIWFEDYQYRAREASEQAHDADYASMSTQDLAAALPGIVDNVGDGFIFTTLVVSEMWMNPNRLIDFCEAELGEEGFSLAASIMQGFGSDSASAAERMGTLAREAAADPQVAKWLLEGDYAAVMSLDASHPFRRELDDYLREYGSRIETWSHMHRPTWEEKPELLLQLVARHVESPDAARSAMERSKLDQRQAYAEVSGRLSEEKRAEFEALVKDIQTYAPMSEARAHWQLRLMGALRRPVGEIAKRMVVAGAIDTEEDVYFLWMEEIQAWAADPARRFQPEVAERRTQFEAQTKMNAPMFIGAPAEPLSPEREKTRHRFHGLIEVEVTAREIKGQAASAGTARGRARVLTTLEEANRVEAGDILVTKLTSPPWTPLFAVAGGVVTDLGGVLSHTAICARECGIPAVVATQVATSVIPDGAMISIDGATGIVTIEEDA